MLNHALVASLVGFLLVVWQPTNILAQKKSASKKLGCSKDPFTTNIFFVPAGNESFLSSILCDLSFWTWRDWQFNLGISYANASSFQPSNTGDFLLMGTEDFDEEQYKNQYSKNSTSGWGLGFGRYYDYQIVIFGFGGISFEILNFTYENNLKLGTWKNKKTYKDTFYDPPEGPTPSSEHTFEEQSQLSMQMIGFGANFCALKLGAIGGLFSFSACYIPSQAVASINEEGVGGGLAFPFHYDRINTDLGFALGNVLGSNTLGIGFNRSVYRFKNIPTGYCPSCPDTTYLLNSSYRISIASRKL